MYITFFGLFLGSYSTSICIEAPRGARNRKKVDISKDRDRGAFGLYSFRINTIAGVTVFICLI